MLSRLLTARTAALMVLGTSLLVCSASIAKETPKAAGEAKMSTFSSEAWKNAKKQPDWSRKQMMTDFCTQYRTQLSGGKMSRTEILSLLGQPELSYEYPQRSTEDTTAYSEITDRYQLSAKSGLFEIAYDGKGMVTRYSWSEEALKYNNFIGPSKPAITLEQARKAAIMLSIVEVKKLLGKPDQEELDVPPNFPTPFRYCSYQWNISNDGRKILWVRTSGPFSEEREKRSIDVTSIITLSPDCPVSR